MLDPDQSVLVLVDIQEKLTRVMHGREELVTGLCQLTACAKALEIPVIAMEQLPDKMGPTIPELRELLDAGCTGGFASSEIEQAWLEEAKRVDREVDAGRMELIPAEEVMRELRKRYGV